MDNRDRYGADPSQRIRFATRASTVACPIVTGSGSCSASSLQFIFDGANAARAVSSDGRTREMGARHRNESPFARRLRSDLDYRSPLISSE